MERTMFLNEAFPGDIRRQTRAFERGVVTELDLKAFTFVQFILALVEDQHNTQRILDEIEQTPEFVQDYFQEILRRLPCEGDRWDWPPGGVLANPGGGVAWQKPCPETQDAIAILRRCVTEFWAARGQVRNLSAGTPGCKNR
jgi:hypothetical protein